MVCNFCALKNKPTKNQTWEAEIEAQHSKMVGKEDDPFLLGAGNFFQGQCHVKLQGRVVFGGFWSLNFKPSIIPDTLNVWCMVNINLYIYDTN